MSRRTARETLAALFVTNGSFTTVNAYAPLDLKGATKVLNIYAQGSRHDRMSRDMINSFHTYNLDVFVKRDGETTEDDLDGLREAVISVCEANPTNAAWSHLELTGESEARFALAAGVAYRLERHRVRVKITS